MQVFLILFSDYFTVFQPLKLFSYIELTLNKLNLTKKNSFFITLYFFFFGL